jgi:hypothetical protein
MPKRTRSSATVAPRQTGRGKRQKPGQLRSLRFVSSACLSGTDPSQSSSSSSSVFAGPVGLYDGSGALLAEVPRDAAVEVTVLGQRCTLRVASEEDALVVTRRTSTDDRKARCEEVLATRAHELSARQRELEAVSREAEAKMAEIKANVEDAESLGQDLVELVVVQGRHEACIRELDSAKDGSVRFAYHEDRKGQAVVLPLGQLSLVPFFAQPVVFLRGPLRIVAVGAVEEKGVERETTVAAWQAEAVTGTVVRSFGTEGNGDNEFDRPWGLAVAGDHVYVADHCSNCIKVHRLDGTFVRAFGHEGGGDGEFEGPCGLSVDGAHVFIVDSCNDRIVVTELDGTFVRAFGTEGNGDGEFKVPEDIAVVGDTVFVADTGNHRICVHRRDGTFARAFGSEGSGEGEFDLPCGVAATEDHVFVADYRNHRVCVHKHNGTFVRAFGSLGSGDGEFGHPIGLAVVGHHVFVTDSDNGRIRYTGWTGASCGRSAAEEPGLERFTVLVAWRWRGPHGWWLLGAIIASWSGIEPSEYRATNADTGATWIVADAGQNRIVVGE